MDTITINSQTTSIDIPASSKSTTTTILNGKEVKVVIKEVHKHTAACEACRARKRKCDGQNPCTYCASKKLQCIFLPQRKRGPNNNNAKKRRIEEDEGVTTLESARYESEILDVIEANNFNNFYGRFVKLIMPLSTQDIMRPETIARKVQSYVALAYIARISGSLPIANKYISQARILGGAIYDAPEVDAVSAMLMFASYWKLVNDSKLGNFYGGLAINIAELVPNQPDGKLGVFLKCVRTFATPNLTYREMSTDMVSHTRELSITAKEDIVCKAFIRIAAAMLGACNYSIISPDCRTLSLKFRVFDDITVSEEDRTQIHQLIGEVHDVIEMCANMEAAPQLRLMHGLECPLYLTLVDLKSGHIQEGVNNSYAILCGLQQLKDANAIGVLAELPMLFLLGATCRTLYLHGHTSIALQLFEYVKLICTIMSPEYNFVLLDSEFAPEGYTPTNPIFALPSSNFNNQNQTSTFIFDQSQLQNQVTTFIPQTQTSMIASDFSSTYSTTIPNILGSTNSQELSNSPYIENSPNFTTSNFTCTPNPASNSPNDSPVSYLISPVDTPPTPNMATAPNTISNMVVPPTYALNQINFEEAPENNDLENILHEIISPATPDFGS